MMIFARTIVAAGFAVWLIGASSVPDVIRDQDVAKEIQRTLEEATKAAEDIPDAHERAQVLAHVGCVHARTGAKEAAQPTFQKAIRAARLLPAGNLKEAHDRGELLFHIAEMIAATYDWASARALADDIVANEPIQQFGTSLEAGSLPRTNAFVPLVQQVASFLGGRREQRQPDVMRVGEVRPVEVPEFRGLKGDVVVSGPQQKRFALTGEGADEVRVEGLERAGAYEVAHPAKKTSRQRWLAVNPVNGASDLQALGEEEQEELFGSVNVL